MLSQAAPVANVQARRSKCIHYGVAKCARGAAMVGSAILFVGQGAASESIAAAHRRRPEHLDDSVRYDGSFEARAGDRVPALPQHGPSDPESSRAAAEMKSAPHSMAVVVPLPRAEDSAGAADASHVASCRRSIAFGPRRSEGHR